MDAVSLAALADEHITVARATSSGRSATSIHGGQGKALGQTLLALAAGRGLHAHDNPGEATVQGLTGQITITAGDRRWDLGAGDHLVIPAARHDLTAVADSAVLLSIVTGDRA